MSRPAELAHSPASLARPGSPGAPLYALAIALLTLVAGALRFYHLTARSLTLDDGFSLFIVRTDRAEFLHSLASELNMALYYILLRCWLQVGHSEFWVRLLSVLLATATIPAIYCVGARLFGRGGGLVAALLLAVHAYDVELSQSVRSYALAILLVTLSSLCALRLREAISVANQIMYVLVSAAAIYSHFLAVLVIAAELLLLIYFRRESWTVWLRLAGALIILLLPVLMYLLHAHTSPLGWVPSARWHQVLGVLYSLTATKERALAYLAMWGIAAYCAILLPQTAAWPYRFALAWLLGPVIAAAVLRPVQSLWIPRFFAICIPAGVLLAAAGVTQVMRWSRVAAAIALLLLLITSASGLRFYFRHPQFTVNWRAAIQYMLPRLQAGDQVAMHPYVRFVFDYYRELYPQPLPPFTIATSLQEPLQMPDPENVWLLAPVARNPDDPASGPQSAEEAVRQFALAHDSYCALSPQPEGGSVLVWQIQRCRVGPGPGA